MLRWILAEKGIRYLGVGISDGEQGARHGPGIMPGSPKEAYEHARSVFVAVAAKVRGAPCVAWLGLGSAGHYVKMVHNGIEYGLMQLIAETCDLTKRGRGFPATSWPPFTSSGTAATLFGIFITPMFFFVLLWITDHPTD